MRSIGSYRQYKTEADERSRSVKSPDLTLLDTRSRQPAISPHGGRRTIAVIPIRFLRLSSSVAERRPHNVQTMYDTMNSVRFLYSSPRFFMSFGSLPLASQLICLSCKYLHVVLFSYSQLSLVFSSRSRPVALPCIYIKPILAEDRSCRDVSAYALLHSNSIVFCKKPVSPGEPCACLPPQPRMRTNQ